MEIEAVQASPGQYSHRETFHWRFAAPVEKIWPVLADTERFNEAAALPRYRVDEEPRCDGGVDYRAVAAIGPVRLRWREVPTNWVENRWFRHERVFENGPLSALCATLRLYPEAQGCRAEYLLEAGARGALGWLMLSTSFFSSTRKNFAELARQADAFACGAAETEFDYARPRLTSGAKERLAQAAEALERTPHGHGLAHKLAELIAEGAEMDVRRIRPLALARRWGAAERRVVELCLQAARDGVLGFRWEILCPRCQSAKAEAPTLDRLPNEAHCGSCNIAFDRRHADSIELVFFPSASLRATGDEEFCLFGPMSTPHVKAQITVAPGAEASVEAALEPGLYRLRTLEPGGEAEIDWLGGRFPAIAANGGSGGACDIALGEEERADRLVFRNASPFERTFIVETREWRRDALSIARATTLQAFSDILSDEVLRPGDYVEVDRVSFMFADLKGSTALYETVGDATAYARTREFFAIIGAAVREHDGTLVKTVGDAVHAAFMAPGDACRCALRIQEAFAALRRERGEDAVQVKIGLHVGRSISVALNNRLDYYGTAVNLAARLCDQSGGGEIVASEAFAEDPGVQPVLNLCSMRREAAALKGFDYEVRFARILFEQDPAGADDRVVAAV